MTDEERNENPGYQRRGDIGLVRFGRAPLNTLSHPMRTELAALLDRAFADDGARAVVVTGIGRAFCAGAEITEFNTPKIAESPTAHDIWAAIEQSSKPVVAAIHGLAMGGGLEFAQACHFRVATADARLAQPEVKLGLIPGAGGTQRLPRAVGVAKALEMMTTGMPVLAAEMAGTRLVDRIAQGDVVEEALRFAADARSLPRLRDADRPRAPEGLFDETRRHIADAQPGFDAPLVIVDCVEAAARLPFDEGLAYERGRFQDVVNGMESRALRRAFFGERRVAKREDWPARAEDIARRLEAYRDDPYDLMNAAVQMLAEGSGYTALEIDMACIAKLGFPRHHGGPLFRADCIGLLTASPSTLL